MSDFEKMVQVVSKKFLGKMNNGCCTEEGLREQFRTAKGKYKVIYYLNIGKENKIQIIREYYTANGELWSKVPGVSIDRKFVEIKKNISNKFKELQEECLKEWPFYVQSYPF